MDLLILNQFVEKPFLVYLIIPLFFVLLLVMAMNLRKATSNAGFQQRKKMKKLVFVTRFLILACLLIALASPFDLRATFLGGGSSAVFLLDNSTSFDIFNREEGYTLYGKLKNQLDIDLTLFGDHQSSLIGDELLQSLQRGGSVLLMSDGRVTDGASLGDVVVEAQKLNVSINIFDVEPQENDYSVIVEGPSKVSSGVETEFLVKVVGTPVREHDVVISVDGQEVSKKKINDESVFGRTFSDGYHTITAKLILEHDYFKENNIFYKTIKVIKKPYISYVSAEESPLTSVMNKVYDINMVGSVGFSDETYAVVVNDLSAGHVAEDVASLRKFVTDGNGLVVVGGLHAFDRGNYGGSDLEELLPVEVGGAGKQEGASSVVVIIDISQSFAIDPTKSGSERYGEGNIGLSKALAVNIIEGIDKEDYLGVVAFDSGSYIISDLEMIFAKNLENVNSKIASLVPALAGETMPTAGIIDALGLLDKGPGAKNIILISDGLIQKKDQFLAAAQQAADQGVIVYTVGVGESTNEQVMQQVAEIGGGSYFKATQKNKVKILFGGEGGSESKDSYKVIIKDRRHFITEDLKIDAKITGFNEVVPKSNAQVLVTTDQGDPLIVVWRIGLGRVAVVLTDDGRLFAGDLLTKQNSKLLLRTLSWAVGDAERKSDSFLMIEDTHLGEPAVVVYKGDNPPEEVDFSHDDGVYYGELMTEEVGFHHALGATYAVNHPQEYQEVGLDPELDYLMQNTGGLVLTVSDVRSIVDTVKTQSQTVDVDKEATTWPFVLLALLLFLFEVCVRRIVYFKG